MTSRSLFVFVLLGSFAATALARNNRPADLRLEAHKLRSYAISQCIAQAFPNTPAGEDATRAFGGYVEMGTSGIETYEKIIGVVQRHMAKPYAGEGGKPLVIMQCLDLASDPALSAVIAASFKKP
jgi:hypothetical protein